MLFRTGICVGDYSNGGVVVGKNIYPEYYGLEVIIALSFRINSANAIIFREWVLKQITTHQNQLPQIFIQLPQKHIFN